jgi:hypothetical protein
MKDGIALIIILLAACEGPPSAADAAPVDATPTDGAAPGFFEAAPFPESWLPYRPGLVLADVASDAALDLVALTASTVYVLVGNGDATWQEPVGSISPAGDGNRLHIGDVTGDGVADFMVWTHHECVVWAGDGLGGGELVTTISGSFEGIQDVSVADVTGDGHDDLIFVERPMVQTLLHIWPSDGAGGLATEQVIAAHVELDAQVITGRFDDDAVADIIIAPTDPPDAELFIADGAGGLLPPVPVTLDGVGYETIVRVIDVDGDGLDDLIAGANYQTWLLRNQGGTFAPRVVLDEGDTRNSRYSSSVGDVDGDQSLDLVVFEQGPISGGVGSEDRAFVLLDVIGGSAERIRIDWPTDARSPKLGDVNSDGKDDIVYYWGLYLAR